MCGRFTLSGPRRLKDLARELGADFAPDDEVLFRPRYNIAPTDTHWIVRRATVGRPRLAPALWGFPGPRSLLINARLETAAQRPTFRDAFQNRRCVVPSDGFLEWTGPRTARRPFWLRPPEGGLLLLAGLFDDGPPGVVPHFVILTRPASAEVAPIHDRMPVVLHRDEQEAWLAGAAAPSVLAPPAPPLTMTEVSSRVNATTHDDPACLDPPAPRPGQLPLL